MNFQWDLKKAENNRRKHDVRFSDAVSIFSDDQMKSIEDDDPNEERFVALGMDAFGRILIVVYAWRADEIRIISARKATRSERNQYEGEG